MSTLLQAVQRPDSLIGGDALEVLNLMARSVSAVAGSFVEVGVYKGGSASILYEIAQEQGRELYLYDTFTGIPEQSPVDQEQIGAFADTSAETVKGLFPKAHVQVGFFPDTLIEMGEIAFLHADADQYATTLNIIHHLSPLMAKGGVMLFDDYGCLAGCTQAVDECFGDRIALTAQGKAFVRF